MTVAISTVKCMSNNLVLSVPEFLSMRISNDPSPSLLVCQFGSTTTLTKSMQILVIYDIIIGIIILDLLIANISIMNGAQGAPLLPWLC